MMSKEQSAEVSDTRDDEKSFNADNKNKNNRVTNNIALSNFVVSLTCTDSNSIEQKHDD
jgi:hypothetical protein